MAAGHISHAVGFDDAPFARAHRGDVLVVGTVFSGARLEGVVSGRVRRDGANATRVLAELCLRSRFAPQLQLIFLQGIALAGFNVIDIAGLHAATGLPVLVVARRRPHLDDIRRALLENVRGGRRKWRLIEEAGAMEPAGAVLVQRAGISHAHAVAALARFTVQGNLPEPLRTAHIIAGGVAEGQSRGGA